jgi:hypothetical protein
MDREIELYEKARKTRKKCLGDDQTLMATTYQETYKNKGMRYVYDIRRIRFQRKQI